jgi:hypothetical protein
MTNATHTPNGQPAGNKDLGKTQSSEVQRNARTSTLRSTTALGLPATLGFSSFTDGLTPARRFLDILYHQQSL